MKKLYRVVVNGCDDYTTVKIELNDVEFELIKTLCEKVTEASEYMCMPTMEINEEKG
jgi:hypothetical protein